MYPTLEIWTNTCQTKPHWDHEEVEETRKWEYVQFLHEIKGTNTVLQKNIRP